MPRLFISHSSKDNVVAVAFKQWLGGNGWAGEDVFLDLDDVGAGERWKEALHKANARCEAVVLLASPNSLASPECLAEVRKAEDFGKEIIVVLLNDVAFDDRRLDSYKDRQIVELAAEPQAHTETVTYRGDSYDVGFNADALARIKDYLIKRGIAPEHFAWPPSDRPNAEPFPGLAAFTEDEAGIFFGRDADILRGLNKLRILRRNRHPRLMVIQAASGAGKSSFLRAGLWPRLKRDPDFAPLAVLRPAQGILTGPDGLGHRLAPLLTRPAAAVTPGDIHAALATDDQAKAAAAFLDLMTSAAKQAHEARRIGDRAARAPALVLAVDQAEELFAAEDAAESCRFLSLLAGLLRDAADTLELFALATIRADSADQLLQALAASGAEASETLPLLPLPATSYRDVILKPIEVLARRGQRIVVEPALADRLAADATGADALPLLAFTLARLYRDFHASGSLSLAQYDTMGGVGGSIDRALAEAQRQAGTGGTTESLRRLMVPGLATWDPAAGAAKRLVARAMDLVGGNRAALEPLSNALVANRLLTQGAGTLEVAHEALLRRQPIAGWLEEEKDALKLRDDVLREAKEWADGGKHDESLVRRGARLESALDLLRRDDFGAALAPARDYLLASQGLEALARRRARQAQALIYTLLLGIIAGLIAFINQERLKEPYRIAQESLTERYHTSQKFLKEQYHWRVTMALSVLSAEQEKAMARSPGSEFTECASGCPKMIVVPAGKFTMRLLAKERVVQRYEVEPDDDDERGQPKKATDLPEKSKDEESLRTVTIAGPFAVGKTAVTFAEWDVCVAAGACPKISDNGWGRGDRPAILVNWQEAKGYVAWLKRITGRDYRLLTEAEWEYSARAGNERPNSFGDDAAKLAEHAWFIMNAQGKTEPVGRRKANGFGLYDMHGNAWQWVEDCDHDSYHKAPKDGSAWVEACTEGGRVVRGGSWHMDPRNPSADRSAVSPDLRSVTLGFRVGRTLKP